MDIDARKKQQGRFESMTTPTTIVWGQSTIYKLQYTIKIELPLQHVSSRPCKAVTWEPESVDIIAKDRLYRTSISWPPSRDKDKQKGDPDNIWSTFISVVKHIAGCPIPTKPPCTSLPQPSLGSHTFPILSLFLRAPAKACTRIDQSLYLKQPHFSKPVNPSQYYKTSHHTCCSPYLYFQAIPCSWRHGWYYSYRCGCEMSIPEAIRDPEKFFQVL